MKNIRQMAYIVLILYAENILEQIDSFTDLNREIPIINRH
jgi:hypothetical protein